MVVVSFCIVALYCCSRAFILALNTTCLLFLVLETVQLLCRISIRLHIDLKVHLFELNFYLNKQ